MLDRCSGQKKEELNFLQNDIDKKKASLSEVLLDGEAEVVNKQRQIRVSKCICLAKEIFVELLLYIFTIYFFLLLKKCVFLQGKVI